jgi:uncharacterized protein YecA (UPF0149 family)
MWKDMIVEELKMNSEDYVKKFDYDIHRIAEDMRKKCNEMGIKTISFAQPKEAEAITDEPSNLML